jgi:hypothetical protein
MLERGLARRRLIGLRLHGYGGAAAELAVTRHEQFRARVLDAEPQRLGAEPAEDEGVDGADAGDRERDDGRLGDDRQVDDDSVARPDAELCERVRRLRHLALQVGVRDRASVAPLALEVVRDPLPGPGCHVPVDTVHGDVEAAAREPLRLRRLQGPVRLQRRLPGVSVCARARASRGGARPAPRTRSGRPRHPPTLRARRSRSRRCAPAVRSCASRRGVRGCRCSGGRCSEVRCSGCRCCSPDNATPRRRCLPTRTSHDAT